jgi:hypothetical protein
MATPYPQSYGYPRTEMYETSQYPGRAERGEEYPSLAGNYADYMENGSLIPGVTSLPIPRAQIPDYRPPVPQPEPPSVGYAGKTGQIANIIANFMHGWQAGKQQRQDRMFQEAQNQATTAWQQYDQMSRVAQNPDVDQKTRDTAAKQIPNALKAYHDIVEKYSAHPDAQEHHGVKGILHKVAQGFLPRQPTLFPAGAGERVNALPTTPPALSPQQQAARAGGQAATTGYQRQITTDQLQDQYSKQLRELTVAQQSKDPARIASATQALETTEAELSGRVAKTFTPGGTALESAKTGVLSTQMRTEQDHLNAIQEASDAMKQNPAMNYAQLSPGIRFRIEQGPDKGVELNSYLQDVGPGRTYSSQREAIEGYLRAKNTARYTMTRGGQYEQIARQRLAGTLQDQNSDDFKRYQGMLGGKPLQPGQQVPESIIAAEAERDMTGVTRTDEQNKTKPYDATLARQKRSEILRSYLQQNPDDAPLFSYGMKDSRGNEQTVYDINAGAGPEQHWWPRPDEAPEAYQQRRTGAWQRLHAFMSQQGYNDDQIKQIGLAEPPGPMAAPPSAPAASPGTGQKPAGKATAAAPGAQQFRVTGPDGKTFTRALTPEQVATAKQHQYTVEPIAATAANPQGAASSKGGSSKSSKSAAPTMTPPPAPTAAPAPAGQQQ